MFSKIVLFLCSFFLFRLAFSQQSDYLFKRYTTKDGLSQSSVLSIVQDRKGFMWFGTFSGLNRFDGNNFKTYLYNIDNPKSICDNRIRSICEESGNALLIGTEGGLSRLILDKEEFVSFIHDPDDSLSLASNNIFKVFRDSDGDVWIGTWGGGLDKFVCEVNNVAQMDKPVCKFIHHKPKPGLNSISSLKIADIVEGRNGILWIGTREGLNKYDKKNRRFTVYKHDPENPHSISDNNVSSVCVDRKGNVWAATWGSGLNLLNEKTGKFIRFFDKDKDPFSARCKVIKTLYVDNNDDMWVGTWGGGLLRVVPPEEKISQSIFKKDDIEYYVKSYRFIPSIYSLHDSKSLSSNSVYSIYEDKTGIMWAGVEWGGVNKFEKSRAKFEHIYPEPVNANSLKGNWVYSIAFNGKEEIWIGTQEGVNIYNKNTGSFKLLQHISDDKESLSNNRVMSIARDNKGIMWVGTVRGLNKYLPKKNKFKRYYYDDENPGNTHIVSILADEDGIIWLGNYGGGMYRFDPEKEEFTEFVNDPNNPNSIANNIVWHIAEDKSNDLWIANGKGGVCRYDKKKGVFENYVYKNRDTNRVHAINVFSVYLDSVGKVWAGTTSGLIRLDFNENMEVSFVEGFKLERGYSCNGILESTPGIFWLTSIEGLLRLDTYSNETTIFDLDDGLQDLEFSVNSIVRDTLTGKIMAGGINGLNVFDPEKIELNRIKPEVSLVDLKIFNKSVNVGQEVNGHQILDKSITYVEHIELTHKEYVVSFEFAALHYQSPAGNTYAYRLDGFETEWNYSKKRSVTYTNLNPGKYTFLCKASNSDGIWNDTPLAVKVSVVPPWNKTIIFRIVLVLTIVLLIYSVYVYRVRYLKARQKLLEESVQLRTEELSLANELLEEKQEEITLQNEELLIHRNNLENLVEVRTAELNNAKVKAEESDKLKSAFLANMSHEVRTPMNAIIGFSSLLDDDTLGPEEKRYYIKMIKNNSDSLLTLINDILDISRIEANQLVLHKEVFCVEEVLEELFSYYKMNTNKKIDILLNVNKNKTYLDNDAVRFRQILNNLLSNAIKYTDQGIVEFGFTIIDEEQVSVYVKDTGIGIDKKDFDTIFNYFHKVEHEARLFQGTGIGLSVSKKLAQIMGGDITLKSEISKGSVFYLQIPKIVNLKRTNQKPKIKTVPDLSNMTIILAEDEVNNYYLVDRILKNTNAVLHWSKNGKEAVDLVQKIYQEKQCIVLMDIKMPVMDGIEAKTRIKKINVNIPVIALTAYAQAGDKLRFIRNGFDDYISKPINIGALIEVLVRFKVN